MSELKIYLLRHGESELNVQRTFAGRSADPALSATGREEATQQAAALEDIAFTAIYASPLQRARQTANFVAEQRELEIVIDDRLREVDVGRLDGLEIRDDNLAYYRDIVRAWGEGDGQAGFEEGESLDDVTRRFGAFLEEVKRTKPAGPILVVGHGILFMAMLWLFTTGHEDDRRGKIEELYMSRGHLSIIADNGADRYQLLEFNLPPGG